MSLFQKVAFMGEDAIAYKPEGQPEMYRTTITMCHWDWTTIDNNEKHCSYLTKTAYYESWLYCLYPDLGSPIFWMACL